MALRTYRVGLGFGVDFGSRVGMGLTQGRL